MHGKHVIGVEFPHNSKIYTFFHHRKLKLGKLVIVSTPNERFIIAKVRQTRGFSPRAINRTSSWIVQEVKVKRWRKRMKREAIILDIKNKLHERRQQAEDLLIYQSLANVDPEIKRLLAELESLDKSQTKPKLVENTDVKEENK